MINLKRIGWEDGTLVSKAKVEVSGQIYDVEPEQYTGTTPLSAANLKEMEDNTEKMFKIALLMLVLLMILKVCSFKHTGALDDAFINYSSQKNIENTDN